MVSGSYSDGEILAKVKEIMEGILQIEPDGISVNSSLIDDLGMESIDFLDLDIRLEETFNISVPRRPPLQRIAAVFGREKLVQEGKLTQIGVRLLKLALSEVDEGRIYKGMAERDVPSLITPQTYVNLVKRGLELARWQPEQCQKCGSKDFTPADKDKLEFPDGNVPSGPVFLCNSCNSIIFPPSFDDELIKQLSEELQ